MTTFDHNPKADPQDFLAGGGEMGSLIRAHDWQSTQLGSPDDWPAPLRTAMRLILNSGHPMYIWWGPELRCFYNDAYRRSIGPERHPKSLAQRGQEVWSEIWDIIGPQIDHVMSGQGATWHENHLVPITRNGVREEVYWTYSYSPIDDENAPSGVGGVLVVCTETTQQVLANRHLEAETGRLRRMFDQAPGFMALLRGPHHVFDLANSAYNQLIGHRDVIGKTVRAALPEVAGQGFLDLLDGVFATGEPFVGRGMPVMLQREPDAPAERRFVDFIYQPITDTSGAVTGIFVEGSDVTDRLAAESELGEMFAAADKKAAELEAILESMPDAVYIGGLQGITLANQPALEQLGFTSREELNRQVATLADEIKTRDAETGRAISAEDQAFTRALRGERVVQDVVVRHRLTGEDRVVRCAAAPVAFKGEVIAAVAVNTDVTEQKEVEAKLRDLNDTLEQRVAERSAELEQAHEQLRQSQKMEAIGQLTGGIAHDFNNLLTPIIGSLDMLQRRGFGSDRERRLIDGALQSADKAKTLVQRLLAFARRQPLQSQAVDVKNLTADMADLVASTSGPHVKVVLDTDEEMAPAQADANQLEMAILNLAVNARDAMPEGGTLTISAREEEVAPPHRSNLPAGPYIRVSIADTGSGMDKATLARSVEPFFSTKGVGKGTGLGLSMVHGLAAQLGGALTIHSKLGLGTCVDLWLPIATKLSPLPERVQKVSGSMTTGIVLLVDDEELVRASTAEMLLELGYEVVEASCGEEALQLLDQGLVLDLLITDHLMPGLNGTDLARELRERGSAVPVVLMSGYADVEGVAPDLPRLTKPFRQSDLAASISDLAILGV